MAKTITEQLLALLPENERNALKAKLDANPALVAQDQKSAEIYSIYQGDETEPTPTPTPTPVAAATPTPVVTPTPTPTPIPVAAGGNDAILAELRNLSTAMDTKLEALRKEFIPASKLPEYEGSIMARAIKASDDLAQVRETHRAEFGKPLDRDAFEKFVLDQQAAGTKFKDMKEAHDRFVIKERTDAEVAKRVDEQVKQKKSGDQVPGQTTAVGLSPAQAVLKKAREAAKGGDGKSNAMAAAEKLAQLERGRDEGAVVN